MKTKDAIKILLDELEKNGNAELFTFVFDNAKIKYSITVDDKGNTSIVSISKESNGTI